MIVRQRERRQQKVHNRDIVRIVRKITLQRLLNRERLRIDGELSVCPFENLLPIHDHRFRSQKTMVVLRITVFYRLPVKPESVFELHLQIRIPGIREIHIVIRLLQLLGKMIDNIEYREAEIGLSGTIRAIDNTILDDIVLNSIQIKTVIAVPRKIKLNLIRESSEIFYGKFCKHGSFEFVSNANIVKVFIYP